MLASVSREVAEIVDAIVKDKGRNIGTKYRSKQVKHTLRYQSSLGS